MASPDDLMRVVARSDGSLAVGRDQPGRGAWLCAGSTACVDAAERRKALDRALRTTLHTHAVDDLRTILVPRGRLDS